MKRGVGRNNFIALVLFGLTWASILGIWIQEFFR